MKKLILLSVLCLFIGISGYSQTYSGGNGTKLNPYLISSKADMETLNSQVGYHANYYLGRYFLLTTDISNITNSIGGGLSNLPFKGTFDGGGHTIDLDINFLYWGYGGLFAYIDNATIKNLRVTGSISTGDYSSGGICGYAVLSTISNCQNEATIINSDYSGNAGGICGWSNSSKIENCLNLGDIFSENNGGGICGNNYESAEIINCFSANNSVTGEIGKSGRIVGLQGSNSKITNSYASPSVLVNRNIRSSQNASSKDGKDISDNPQCEHTATTILLYNTLCPVHWEKSDDNGATWSIIEHNGFIYIEQNPVAGKTLYRALNQDNSYSSTEKFTYLATLPATINISPQSAGKVVDESITFTINESDPANNYQWYQNSSRISGAISNTYSIATIKSSNAGNYSCLVSNQCSSVTSSIATLTVTKATQIIDFPEIPNKTYGDLAFNLSAKTDKGLTISYQSSNPSVAKISGNVVTILKAGETNITATQDGDLNYLSASPVTRTLKVNQASQSFNLSEIPTKTYGDFPFELAATTDQGLNISYSSANTDIATIAGNKVTILKAGSTNIIANQAGNENYKSIAEVSVSLIVNKAPLSIRISDLTKEYGEETKGFKISYIGFKNNDSYKSLNKDVKITVYASTMTNVGVYDIILNDAISDNYDISYINAKLTITKAPLTIIPENYKILIGTAIPEFKLSYSGFKGTDDPSKLGSLPAIICNVNANSLAGNYNISLQGGGDKNYEYLFQNGILSIINNFGTTAGLTWLIDNKVLTISGTGNMPDYSYSNSENTTDIPWYDIRQHIGEIVLMDGITNIGKYSFADCISNSISIAKTVISIGEKAFVNCSNLNKITVRQVNPPALGEKVFQGVNTSTCILEIPKGSTTKYRTANQWKDFTHIAELEFNTSRGDYKLEGLKIYTISNKIVVEGLHQGEQVQLYNIAGQLICNTISINDKIEISISEHGVYVLKTNRSVIKVAL